MFMRPPRYLKARPPGTSAKQPTWQTQENVTLSTKPDDVSTLIEDLNNSQFLEVGNQKIYFSELPKKGFRHVGFKQLGLKKYKHINAKSELPQLGPQKPSRPNLNRSQASQASIQSNLSSQVFNSKNGGFIAGYQVESMNKGRYSLNQSREKKSGPMEKVDNSFEVGNTAESSRYETAVSKRGDCSNSVDFIQGAQNERVSRIMKQDEDFGGKSHGRTLTRESFDKASQGKGPNLKYLAYLSREKSCGSRPLRNVINEKSEVHYRSTPAGLKPVVSGHLSGLKEGGNVNQEQGSEDDNGSNMSRCEPENFERKKFMNMIYKKLGRSIEGYGKDAAFEKSYEESRISFEIRLKKRLSSLKKL